MSVTEIEKAALLDAVKRLLTGDDHTRAVDICRRLCAAHDELKGTNERLQEEIDKAATAVLKAGAALIEERNKNTEMHRRAQEAESHAIATEQKLKEIETDAGTLRVMMKKDTATVSTVLLCAATELAHTRVELSQSRERTRWFEKWTEKLETVFAGLRASPSKPKCEKCNDTHWIQVGDPDRHVMKCPYCLELP